MRPDDEVLVDDGLGFSLLSVEDQLPHFVQARERTRAVVVMGTAAPECLFVELDLLFLDTAIYHGSHVGVAQGQRFQPDAGRRIVP